MLNIENRNCVPYAVGQRVVSKNKLLHFLFLLFFKLRPPTPTPLHSHAAHTCTKTLPASKVNTQAKPCNSFQHASYATFTTLPKKSASRKQNRTPVQERYQEPRSSISIVPEPFSRGSLLTLTFHRDWGVSSQNNKQEVNGTYCFIYYIWSVC